MAEFPNSPNTFRPFWEQMARYHKRIKHDPENKINRFWEMLYVDFPYDDWDMSEWNSLQVANLGLSVEKFPDMQAMGILSFETQYDDNRDRLLVPTSLFFVKSVRSTQDKIQQAKDKQEAFQATYETAISFRNMLRKYFKNVSEKGVLEVASFQTIQIRMPLSSNPIYGTRLDFKYSIYVSKSFDESDWEINPIPPLTIPPQ
jgi:hypothetical protein